MDVSGSIVMASVGEERLGSMIPRRPFSQQNPYVFYFLCPMRNSKDWIINSGDFRKIFD